MDMEQAFGRNLTATPCRFGDGFGRQALALCSFVFQHEKITITLYNLQEKQRENLTSRDLFTNAYVEEALRAALATHRSIGIKKDDEK